MQAQTSPADTARASIGARRNPATEAAVLDAAMQIIAEQGFASLTMESVARRARAGKATLYRWWPSRAHLLLALYSRAKSALPEPDSGDMMQDLTAHLADMLRQLNGSDGQQPLAPLLRLLIAEAQTDATVRQALEQQRQESWLHLDHIFARAQQRGELNPALSPRQAAQRLIAMLWYLLLTDALPAPDQAATLVRTLTADLRA
ncbi:MAG: TetR/AcrR family transcriptional regulator [Paracoccus sp. (in: a-proteobacteria)]|uniref:TetR/AcrR family transcriptional regulator n=1 Tax=Paracoccus sp. TaxID=267 RepID=UPI0026E0CF38|nr:TetR/AcrR family transcriptional regulator [Paracoccus sp. (in: a-proteobacteria)]MDO5611798.1 TetR/AcrR family transcriptional regulator [Paracoccus sp. (in: a-proteobacteria)]